MQTSAVLLLLLCMCSLQTSQDFSICVWEIRSQKLVARLKGHTATVVSFLDVCLVA